ncbi:MAG: hypothetical protein U9O96_07905 [Candidatus Thermoplasmatota archaeon]|nr:hypothetical protein [Candidatus Thermoplasmatota archaeon]
MPIYTRIVEPERGAIYFGGRKIMELENHCTIVFERINARVEILSNESIERVEFYFDGELRGVSEDNPYEYKYGKVAMFNHMVRAVTYGERSDDGNEIEVMVFNLIPKYWLD